MADIEEKLNKSLDDLIKEASNKRQDPRGSGGARAGRRSTSASGKRIRKSNKSDGDDMEVEERGGGSILGTAGGVGKKRQGRANMDFKAAPKRVSVEVPKGNIDGKWKHDLHHQLQDDAPARPRKPLSHRASRTKPEIMRLVELSNVPQAVTVDDIRDLCETAVQVEDILNVQSQAIGHAWKMTIEFGSEAAASTFVHKYQDVVLDGVALDVRTRGVAVPAYLKSGVRVSTKQQPGRQGENGAPPRGRGSSGRMRSDRMDE